MVVDTLAVLLQFTARHDREPDVPYMLAAPARERRCAALWAQVSPAVPRRLDAQRRGEPQSLPVLPYRDH